MSTQLLADVWLAIAETYAIYDPDYLSTVQAVILDVISDLPGCAGRPFHPRSTQNCANFAAILELKNPVNLLV